MLVGGAAFAPVVTLVLPGVARTEAGVSREGEVGPSLDLHLLIAVGRAAVAKVFECDRVGDGCLVAYARDRQGRRLR